MAAFQQAILDHLHQDMCGSDMGFLNPCGNGTQNDEGQLAQRLRRPVATEESEPGNATFRCGLERQIGIAGTSLGADPQQDIAGPAQCFDHPFVQALVAEIVATRGRIGNSSSNPHRHNTP